MKGVEVKTVCLYAIAWIAKNNQETEVQFAFSTSSVCMLLGLEFQGGVTHKYKFSLTVSWQIKDIQAYNNIIMISAGISAKI